MTEAKPLRRFPAKTKPKGLIVDAAARARIESIFAAVDFDFRRREYLIENLHRIQDQLGAVPRDSLAALAEAMNLSFAEAFEAATFYHHFDIVAAAAPPPLPTIRVCDSLSCRLAGGDWLPALRARVGGEAVVKRAPCVGRCAAAPVAVVGQNAIERADVDSVVAALREKRFAAEIPTPIDFAACREKGGYEIWRQCKEGARDVESVIAEIEAAELRGLGGAGFPAARKWKITRGFAAPRALAVNIDEGEPGTFKDRHYLESDPHRAIEGALIAAWAVGADAAYFYLRDEYHGCRAMFEAELRKVRESGIADIDLILRRGAGAYICGEESAMIESIEGKRGEPRLRPPYIAEVGVFGRPTLEHNFETLHWVPEILRDGAPAYARQGRRGRKGLRSFSVSGRVAKPGVHVAAAGITARELIEERCGGMARGHRFYGYLPGGASGGILPAAMADIPLDFDCLQARDSNCFLGSAAVIVLSHQDRARDAAENIMHFFEDESCGQCTPCRVGTAKAAKLMRAPKWDSALLEELCEAMADASICGLGQAAPNPIRSVLRHFAAEVE